MDDRVRLVMLLLIVLSFVLATKGDGSWSFVLSKLDFPQHKPQDMQQYKERSKYTFQQDENESLSGLRNQLLEMEERIQNKQDVILNKLYEMESNTTEIIHESKNPEYISSCLEEPTQQSGTYLIKLGPNKQALEVNCEQHVFEGGWIVFQHRYTGEENFFRNWSDFRDGFGDLNGEYWLGLRHIHQITASRPHELVVEIKDFNGTYGYAHYDEFEVGSELEGYNLKKLGKYQGTAGDAMESNRGQRFSTSDRDNDGGCAVGKKGGWWYENCSYANLNGPYMNVTNGWSSMSWQTFKKDYRGLSFSRMMIRELSGEK